MNRTESDLFIIGSPWHAILALAIISKKERDTYFIIEYKTDKTTNEIDNVLGQYVHQVIARYSWVDYDLNNFKRPYLQKRRELKRNVNLIKESHSGQKFDRVYVFNIYSQMTRVVLDSISLTKLYKVEDGVLDYIEFRQKKSFVKRLIVYIFLASPGLNKYFDHNLRFYNKYRRSRSSIMMFPEQFHLNWPKKNLLPYRDAINDLLKVPEWLSLDSKRKSALLLGQTLVEDSFLSLEKELDIYKRAIQKLLDEGYYVYFKPHPRSTKAKLDAIKTYGYKNFELMDLKYPAEYLLANESFEVIVGLWSNTILYSKVLFDVNSVSLLPSVLSEQKNKDKTLFKINAILGEKFHQYYTSF